MRAIVGASNTILKVVRFINCLWSNQPASRAFEADLIFTAALGVPSFAPKWAG
jgi:hypothetical protein